MRTLEATKAAANFTEVLGAVRSLHASFKIVSRGVPCAYLVPIGERETSSHELADDLAGTEFSADERRAIGAALRKGRQALKPLKNPWD
jgi:prevent-host-death family protein